MENFTTYQEKINSYRDGILTEFIIEFKNNLAKLIDIKSFSITKAESYFYLFLEDNHQNNITLTFYFTDSDYDVFLSVNDQEIYLNQDSDSYHIAISITKALKE